MGLELTQTRLDFSAVDQRMQSYVDQEILGSVATLVLQGTDIVHARRHGYMSVEGKEPLREDAIFRMYSNTKLVTSVALMMLYEEGRFGLDDPLAEYLPRFANPVVLKDGAASASDVAPAEGPMRMRHILSHSAGFSYGFIEPDSVIDRAYNQSAINPMARSDMTLESLCDELATLPLCYEPGTNWRYSLATDVCARMVEVLSGQPFDAFLKERIFDPLGMVDTGFFVPEKDHGRLVTMYSPADMFDPMKPGFVPTPAAPGGTHLTKPSFLSGGGGLVSTMSDYSTFIRMIVAGGSWAGYQFLRPETLDLMRTNQLAPGIGVRFPMWSMPNTVFGLGFALKTAPADGESNAVVGEYHWGGMAGTHSWMSPKPGITGLCFTQRMPGFWHPFSHDFKRLVYAALE